MLSVLYEDADVLAVNKPAGIVVHPAYRHPDGTLFDAIARRQELRGEQRPCLLHRLDRDTSGVVLLAKTDRSRRGLVHQFERRQVRKWYLALVWGWVDHRQVEVRQPLRRDPADRRRMVVAADGQEALTHVELLAVGANQSLVLAQPYTGRTHQIRVHLAWLGHPIVGDTVYDTTHASNSVPDVPVRHMLHAWVVYARHPASGAPLTIPAPVPADMAARLPADWHARCEAHLSAP